MKAFGEKRLKWLTQQSIHYFEKAKQFQEKGIEFARLADEEADLIDKKREEYVEKQMRAERAAMQAVVDEATGKTSKVAADQAALSRAKTFAIIDTILFAIENWASDDSPAPDITLASQATLFPVFLQAAGQGDENYYLTEVPSSAALVVERGREFVRKFREEEHISVLDPTGWAVLQPILHKWWTRDAMPLLYGSGYEGWEFEEPYTLEQMMTWRDREMSRAMDFPVIFDGYELVRKYGDEIREETGLPAFSRQMLKSRIKAHG